eukprot:7993300-Karenia_brevis.AAC.1
MAPHSGNILGLQPSGVVYISSNHLQIVCKNGIPWKKKIMSVQERIASFVSVHLLKQQHAHVLQEALSGKDMFRLPINVNIP